MKKLIVLGLLFSSIFICQQANAQVSVTINVGSQPDWGPVGYDYVDYYYMPDIDAYYYVPQKQYIYLESNRWVFAHSLPSRLRWYDPYHGYKVVVNEPKPYLHHETYRARYGKYKGSGGPQQVIIRDSHDNRYKNNQPGRSEHHDNGNGKNNGNGNEGKHEHGNQGGNGRGHGNGHGKKH